MRAGRGISEKRHETQAMISRVFLEIDGATVMTDERAEHVHLVPPNPEPPRDSPRDLLPRVFVPRKRG